MTFRMRQNIEDLSETQTERFQDASFVSENSQYPIDGESISWLYSVQIHRKKGWNIDICSTLNI